MSQAVADAVLSPENVASESLVPTSQTTPKMNPQAAPVSGSLFAIETNVSGEGSEFSYRPLTPLAPITLFFGISSATAYFDWYGVAIGGVGFLFGLLCLWKIWRSNWDLSGWALAKFATFLCAVGLFGGTAWQMYLYKTELPEGYERVNFSWLSDQLPVVKDGKTEIHPDVAKLDGHDIFIKGYMYPTRQQEGLKEFVLLKDTGECCFGGNPKLSDMIVVKLQGDLTATHRDMQLVSVAGKFHAGARADSAGLSAVYTLDGTHFK